MLGIPRTDVVDNGLRATPIHVICALHELQSMRVLAPFRIRIERVQVAVCIVLIDDSIRRTV